MRPIPFDVKKELFNKDPHELLNKEEEAVWNDYASGNLLKAATLDIDSDDFWDDLQAYHYAREHKAEAMAKVEARLKAAGISRNNNLQEPFTVSFGLPGGLEKVTRHHKKRYTASLKIVQ